MDQRDKMEIHDLNNLIDDLEDENRRLKQAISSAYQRCNLDHATKDILHQALFIS